ncbi:MULTISPECIES: hypothetical protein [unclassified Microcoleus]|uniref:hypothetical protein n=1 Tax=unclassified Microcoleus TaxID=2642155 RepID=UPI0025EC1360|nr:MULTISPECIES: hypothetical protein [unclassified Microcoleus]
MSRKIAAVELVDMGDRASRLLRARGLRRKAVLLRSYKKVRSWDASPLDLGIAEQVKFGSNSDRRF